MNAGSGKFVIPQQNKGYILFNVYDTRTNAYYALFEQFPITGKMAPLLFAADKILSLMSYHYPPKLGRMLRYFTSIQTGAGIGDRTGMLKHQIATALLMGRIPIIPPLLLDPAHNSGIKLTSPWSKYYDMKNITACFCTKTENTHSHNEEIKCGPEKKIEIISRFDFVRKRFGHLRRIKSEPIEDIVHFQDKNYPKIIGIHTGGSLHVSKNLRYSLEEKLLTGITLKINLRPSAKVVEISQQVTDKLGSYCALHIRGGDVIHRLPSLAKIRELTKNMMGEEYRTLYFMTNEKDDSRFLEVLRQNYTVYRYYDFPELAKLVSGRDADNQFLYTIERMIFTSAKARLAPLKKDGKLGDRSPYICF